MTSRVRPASAPALLAVLCACAVAPLLLPASSRATPVIDPDWLARWDGPAHAFDRANAVQVGPGGVSITGDADDGSFEKDLFVARYSFAGELVWSAMHAGAGGGWDRGLAIAVDAGGAVYVTGVSWGGEATDHDAITLKYSPDGEELWVARYDGPIHAGDRTELIALDGHGGVVVCGFSYFADSPKWGLLSEYLTIRYDAATGEELWTAHHVGPGPYHRDTAHGLAVDPQGDVLATGASYDNDRGWDYATVKYRGGDGALLWERRFDYGLGSIDEAFAVATGPDGQVGVTGSASTDPFQGTRRDVVTILYDRDGNELWIDFFNGPGELIDEGRAVTIDPAGNLSVVGQGSGRNGSADYLTMVFAPAGERRWIRLWDNPRGTDDYGMAVAVDQSGNVFVAGESHYNDIYSDMVTLKYDADGAEIWLGVHDGPMNTNDPLAGLAVDADGAAYVAGASRYANEEVSWDAVVLKYTGESTTGAPGPLPTLVRRLSPAAPNPFGAVTSLDLTLERAGQVRLEVHDLRGRRVRVLATQQFPPGTHRFTWDGRDGVGQPVAAGAYFCRLRFGDDVEVRRLDRLR